MQITRFDVAMKSGIDAYPPVAEAAFQRVSRCRGAPGLCEFLKKLARMNQRDRLSRRGGFDEKPGGGHRL